MSDVRTAKGWHREGWRYHATSPDGVEALATTMAEAVKIAKGNRVCQITAAGKLKPLRRAQMTKRANPTAKTKSSQTFYVDGEKTTWAQFAEANKDDPDALAEVQQWLKGPTPDLWLGGGAWASYFLTKRKMSNPDDAAPKAKPKKRKWKPSTHTARVLAPRPLTTDEISALAGAAQWLYDVQINAQRVKDETGFSNAHLTVGAIAQEPEFWTDADPEVIAGAAEVMRRYRKQAGEVVYDAARQAMATAGVDELNKPAVAAARKAVGHVAKRRTIIKSKTRANETKRVYVERDGAMLDIFRDVANKRLGDIIRETWPRRAQINRSNWHWEVPYTSASEWQRFVRAVRAEGWTIVFPDDSEATDRATYSSKLELKGLPTTDAEVAAAAATSAKASGFEILGFRNLRAEHALTIIWPNNKPQSREVNAVIKGKAWGWKFGEQLEGRDGKSHDANSANLPYRRVFEVVKIFVEKGWLDAERANKTLEVIGSSYRIAEGGGLEDAAKPAEREAPVEATVSLRGKTLTLAWLNDGPNKWGFQGAFKGSGLKWDWKSDPQWTKVSGHVEKAPIFITRLRSGPMPALATEVERLVSGATKPVVSGSIIKPKHVKLFKHQGPGIKFLMDRDAALLADDMGLGKTLESVIAARSIISKGQKVLVVCPASVTHNWAEEILKWTDAKPSQIAILTTNPLKSRPIERSTIGRNTQWVIVSYDTGRKPMLAKLQAQRWAVAIFDEAHRLKNTKTKNHALAKGLDAGRMWFLTGTPAQNRPADFWGLLLLLDHPLTRMRESLWMDGVTHNGIRTSDGNVYGGRPGEEKMRFGWEAFMVKYADGWKGKWGWETKGATNTDDLAAKLSSSMLRRTKDEVLDLPGKNRIERRSMVPTTLTNKGFKDIGELSKLRAAVAKAKAKSTIEAVKDVLEAEDKVVVFSGYIAVLDALQESLTKAKIGWVRVDGSVTGRKRQAAVKKFQTDPEVRVFIGQINAAGEGITLTAARTVIFNDLALVPAYHRQAEDRIYRIGQSSSQPVSILYMVSDAVIDRIVGHMLSAKIAMIEAVEGGLIPPEAGEITFADLSGAVESELRKNPRGLWG